MQSMLLPADCPAVPRETPREETLATGALSVHWIADIAVPEDDDSDRSMETVLPGEAVTDDKASEDCASNGVLNSKSDESTGIQLK